MITLHWFFWLFVTFFILHEVWESSLTLLNISYTQKHRGKIPPFYQGKIKPNQYEKSINYTVEKARFDLLTSLIKIPIIWAFLLMGGFAYLDTLVSHYFRPTSLSHSIAYCMLITYIIMLLQIPQSLYSNFVIEEKYGFNKMTFKTFLVDLIKMLLLSALFGIPLLYVVFWLYYQAGSFWWLWAFLAFFGFELFIATIYPTFLAPIFNKFTPLPDGDLKESILKIARKIKFKLAGIYTIDGSKRSAHSNAYFAGMGRLRRIVLFDTIMKNMSNPEIVSVLAHEMGHNIKKHVQKHLILSFFMGLIGFWILSLLIEWEPFFTTFGADSPAPHKALILFGLFAGYFTFWMTPLMNWISRKHEYEADRFSVETTKEKENMASALMKLSNENLSNLTPHPLYSFCHYSHPTTLERIQAIESL